MNPIKLIVNILLSAFMMITFAYIFFYTYIINFERDNYYDIIRKMSNNIVTNDEIYDVIKTTMNVKLFESINKHLDALALKLFLGIAIPSLVITIMLIYLFQLNLKKLLITNMIILSTTILAELIFVFVFTKNLTILDNTSLQLIIQKSIADYYKQSFDYYYSTICK